MNIQDISIENIIPYARNPRKNDDAITKVASSIKEYGFKQPIVVDKDMVIIAGHTRYQAAKKLGYETVPVLIASDLTEAQAKAYRIADNKTGEYAEWDRELLRLEFMELENLTYDTTLSGFDLYEIKSLDYGYDDVILDKMPDLASGEKPPYQQKTFTLHDEQAAIVDDAMTLARTNPLADTGINENSNGNALSLICEQWLKAQNGNS